MKRNVGRIDQIVRYALGAILVVVAILTQIWWLLIPAAIAVVTAAVGRCGLYKLFGINTCKLNPKE
jgi:hypothetical protein